MSIQTDDIVAHWSRARHLLYLAQSLPESTDPAVTAARNSYSANARAEMELVRFLWGWPSGTTGYPKLP